jgi:hypothetical protein
MRIPHHPNYVLGMLQSRLKKLATTSLVLRVSRQRSLRWSMCPTRRTPRHKLNAVSPTEARKGLLAGPATSP